MYHKNFAIGPVATFENSIFRVFSRFLRYLGESYLAQQSITKHTTFLSSDKWDKMAIFGSCTTAKDVQSTLYKLCAGYRLVLFSICTFYSFAIFSCTKSEYCEQSPCVVQIVVCSCRVFQKICLTLYIHWQCWILISPQLSFLNNAKHFSAFQSFSCFYRIDF